MKIVTVVGARPQFIKAAVLSRLIREPSNATWINEVLVHTGQHYDDFMSSVFFRELNIPEPDYYLGVGSGTHGYMIGTMMIRLEEIVLKEKPDLLLVYGDTNSTLTGALVASKLQIPIAHVEAGLRSFWMAMPEEQNRRLTDHLSTWLFCPTEQSVRNLEREGIPYQIPKKPSADNKAIVLCGDIMYQASLYYRNLCASYLPNLATELKDFFLVTVHRAENTDKRENLERIFIALNSFKKIPAIFPIHPRTLKALKKFGIPVESHVHLLGPVGYLEMLALENKCSFIVTDSGGVQKEAYFYRKPCITLRDTTEWGELVDTGWNVLAGTDPDRILQALHQMPQHGMDVELYGKGDTAEIIIRAWREVYT